MDLLFSMELISADYESGSCMICNYQNLPAEVLHHAGKNIYPPLNIATKRLPIPSEELGLGDLLSFSNYSRV